MAWKVDLWRYCRLYESGGLYLDADALLLRPLSTEAFEHDCIFVYDPVGKNVWNGLLYARRPGNPILKAVIEFMIEAGPSWGGVRAHHFHYNIDFLWCRRGVLFCSTASRRTRRFSTQGGGQAPLRHSGGLDRTARRRGRLGPRGLATSAEHALVLHDHRPV